MDTLRVALTPALSVALGNTSQLYRWALGSHICMLLPISLAKTVRTPDLKWANHSLSPNHLALELGLLVIACGWHCNM